MLKLEVTRRFILNSFEEGSVSNTNSNLLWKAPLRIAGLKIKTMFLKNKAIFLKRAIFL